RRLRASVSGGGTSARPARRNRRTTALTRSGSAQRRSLLVPQEFVDAVDVTFGHVLELLLGPYDVCLAGLAVPADPVEFLLGAAADVAYRYPGVLGLRPRHL